MVEMNQMEIRRN